MTMTDTDHPTKTNSDSANRPFASVNPYTGETVKTFDFLPTDQVVPTIEAAHQAFLSWRQRSVAERAAVVRRAGDLMLERGDDLAALITLEMGKLIAESHFEVELAASILQYYGDHGDEFLAPEKLVVDDGEA